jgi:hypothetical protein
VIPAHSSQEGRAAVRSGFSDGDEGPSMTVENGNGNGNGQPYRTLMDDQDLARQFEVLVSVARIKGYTEDEIGYGLFSATVETLLANGEPECCIMQVLVDFMSSYFDYWHSRMADEEEWDNEEE